MRQTCSRRLQVGRAAYISPGRQYETSLDSETQVNILTALKSTSTFVGRKDIRAGKLIARDRALDSPYVSEMRTCCTHRVDEGTCRISLLYNVNPRDTVLQEGPAVFTPWVKQAECRDNCTWLQNPSFVLWIEGLPLSVVLKCLRTLVAPYEARVSLYGGSFPYTTCSARVVQIRGTVPVHCLACFQMRNAYISEPSSSGKCRSMTEEDTPPYTAHVLLRRVRLEKGGSHIIDEKMARLMNRGFINYYGLARLQYFYSARPLLHRRWSDILPQMILQAFTSHDQAPLELSQYCKTKSTSDASKLLSAIKRISKLHSPANNSYQDRSSQFPRLPSWIECALTAVVESGGNHLTSLRHIPALRLRDCILAVQCRMWNYLAGQRVQRYGSDRVVVGDLVVDHALRKAFSCTTFPRYVVRHVRDEEDAKRFRIFDVVLPLPYNSSPLHETDFPRLEGVNSKAYVELAQRWAVESFWKIPDDIGALCEMKPLWPEYRLVVSRPLSLKHRLMLDPLPPVFSGRRLPSQLIPDAARILVNDRIAFELRQHSADENNDSVAHQKTRILDRFRVSRLASMSPMLSPVVRERLKEQNISLPNLPLGDPFTYSSVSLALEIQLPYDVNLTSCLRETFALLPPSTKEELMYQRDVASAYYSSAPDFGKSSLYADADGMTKFYEDVAPSPDKKVAVHKDASTKSWICEFCGSPNTSMRRQCGVCGVEPS